MNRGYRVARYLALASMLVAVTIAATAVLRLPALGGKLYFHFGTAVIFTTALVLGPRMGALVGALGSALADIVLGFWLWFPISFFIHGVEGYIVGYIATGEGGTRDFRALLAGGTWTVLAYALAAGLIYGRAAVPIEITGDLAQVGVGGAVAWFLAAGLRRAYPRVNEFRNRGEIR